VSLKVMTGSLARTVRFFERQAGTFANRNVFPMDSV